MRPPPPPTSTLEDLLVTERELWPDGPPHELFKRLRAECPVHWTAQITEYPEEAGYWSVTTADDVHEVSHDWADLLLRAGGVTALTNAIMPLELTQAMFIGMDPPKHDRLKMLFQRGFTPKRIAEHEDAIRAITVGVLDGLADRETCDLVTDVAQPVVSRVIGSFMGIPPEDDEIWARLMNTTLGAGDPDLNPEGVESVMERDVPEIFERCRAADRRAPRAADRRPDQRPGPRRGRRRAARGARDRDGLLPARRRRQRQHQGDLLQRDARADGATRSSASSCSTTRR